MLKITLLCSLLFINIVPAFSSAYMHIDQDVYKTIDSLAIKYSLTDSAKEFIIDTIYEGLYESSSGDDGKECPTEVFDLVVLEISKNKFIFTYETQQDYVSTYGCMSSPSICISKIEIKNKKIEAQTSCEYQY